MARRHSQLARGVLTRVSQRLVNIDPDKLSPTDLERWLCTAPEIKRTAYGDPDQEGDAAQQAAGAITELVKSLRR